VQLHGNESTSYASAINRPVIKAVPVGDEGSEPITDAWPSRVTLLLDALDSVKRGGTGRTIDWTRAAPIAAARPVMLAGGLTPENVVGAIRTVRPFGIDVSSGVERSPGIKDHARLEALFEAVATQTP
jgi:phosphoribosylanthranilate isomerase